MIFIAAYMSKHSVAKFKGFFFILLLGLITAVLIMLEPNMSITMCVLGSVLIMLFIGGAKIKYFILLILPLLGAVILLIVIEPYRMSRLIAFIDPWASPRAEGYQLIQSYYSLGSGGLFGVGLFNSRQKYMFLPFSESDIILSIIGEELGLCGITLIMVIFIMLIFKGIKIAGKAEDRFRSYLAFSIIIVIAIQSALNIAVVSGAIPPTGLPLPFISSGGSSLVSFLTASGILLNISNHAF
jgi:cell division protein FtsW